MNRRAPIRNRALEELTPLIAVHCTGYAKGCEWQGPVSKQTAHETTCIRVEALALDTQVGDLSLKLKNLSEVVETMSKTVAEHSTDRATDANTDLTKSIAALRKEFDQKDKTWDDENKKYIAAKSKKQEDIVVELRREVASLKKELAKKTEKQDLALFCDKTAVQQEVERLRKEMAKEMLRKIGKKELAVELKVALAQNKMNEKEITKLQKVTTQESELLSQALHNLAVVTSRIDSLESTCKKTASGHEQFMKEVHQMGGVCGVDGKDGEDGVDGKDGRILNTHTIMIDTVNYGRT
jgi:hypothetical protein